ncbi:UNVERIFIED_CONTAM: hypothetical protein Slati_2986600 [Sesamum latifolium]|uniref:Reverse transcriptase n=1 Tax=Sesamum latifolium TaxID=2727402 RepID=A0AAW2VG42_9LAMI
MYSITQKLKLLKPVFRKLRKAKGDLTSNVKQAITFLARIQQLLMENRNCTLLLELEKCCRLVYSKVMAEKQMMLKQRAKLKWLKEGDVCSRTFFHKIKAQKVVHRIFQIQNRQGEILMEHKLIIEEFVSYFKDFLGSPTSTQQIDLQFLLPWVRHTISDIEAASLSQNITDQEVKEAVFDIADDKSLGPDGFPSGFFKDAWSVVGVEMNNAVKEFYTSGRLLK